MRRVKLTTVGS